MNDIVTNWVFYTIVAVMILLTGFAVSKIVEFIIQS